MPTKEKTCRYCQNPARLVHPGAVGYPYRSDFGPVWICVPCEAWVGCHKGTTNALGGLANAELRDWKMKAHAAFDPLWQAKIRRDGCSRSKARRAGYRWLSEQLGIPPEKTHIGYMSVEECQRVVQVCEAIRRKA
ncbi:zinc-finger-containing protein [Paraburkholderia sacchari]|uniref:zinc-finger-containing protein n=1 Tax=Paraburkholderia sacchari TaxID=159450 RepID=UPI001BCD62FF|nr:zinc-finger-containing protein [Paraburkholderia sacchari]